MPLEDYKVEHRDYQYIVPATVALEEKITLLREFLDSYQEDYDFQKSTNGWEEDPISYCIVWARFEGAPKLLIQIATGATQIAESKAVQKAWVDILQLSTKLEDRWNGSVYHVGKRRSLECKRMVLEQFLFKYEGFQFEVKPDYDGKKSFRVVASIGRDSISLLLDYSTTRVGEEDDLTSMMSVTTT